MITPNQTTPCHSKRNQPKRRLNGTSKLKSTRESRRNKRSQSLTQPSERLRTSPAPAALDDRVRNSLRLIACHHCGATCFDLASLTVLREGEPGGGQRIEFNCPFCYALVRFQQSPAA